MLAIPFGRARHNGRCCLCCRVLIEGNVAGGNSPQLMPLAGLGPELAVLRLPHDAAAVLALRQQQQQQGR